MRKQAIIIYGPPGAGKGTQAELLAKKFNFIHFDTGRYIEGFIRNPEVKKSKILQREKKLFDSGKLCTPSWVLRIVREATKKIHGAGFGIVFSGSPRTMFEAFGDKKNQGLLYFLIKLYGKKNVSVIKLNIRGKTTFNRNSIRKVCSICGLPRLEKLAGKSNACVFCAGPMRVRSLDTKEVIKVRLKEYRERTYSILKGARKLGIRIYEINGEPLPYKVHAEIIKKLRLR